MKLNIVLAAVLVLCAFSLVNSQHRARKAFIELERAHDETRRLDQAWSQLQLEQAAYGKQRLVDEVARNQLGMRPVSPDRTQYVILEVHKAAAGKASGVEVQP
jgi:cell division protein FtsL